MIAIVPTADRGKATLKVRVALEQKDARLVPDIGVRVSFLGSKPSGAASAAPQGVLVPAPAVVQRNGRSVVFVVVEGKAQQRDVKPAAQAAGSMVLLPESPGTVKVGERVVVSPSEAVRDGVEVRFEDKT